MHQRSKGLLNIDILYIYTINLHMINYINNDVPMIF